MCFQMQFFHCQDSSQPDHNSSYVVIDGTFHKLHSDSQNPASQWLLTIAYLESGEQAREYFKPGCLASLTAAGLKEGSPVVTLQQAKRLVNGRTVATVSPVDTVATVATQPKSRTQIFWIIAVISILLMLGLLSK